MVWFLNTSSCCLMYLLSCYLHSTEVQAHLLATTTLLYLSLWSCPKGFWIHLLIALTLPIIFVSDVSIFRINEIMFFFTLSSASTYLHQGQLACCFSLFQNLWVVAMFYQESMPHKKRLWYFCSKQGRVITAMLFWSFIERLWIR